MDSWILQNIDVNSLTSTSLFNVMSLFDVLEIYIYEERGKVHNQGLFMMMMLWICHWSEVERN